MILCAILFCTSGIRGAEEATPPTALVIRAEALRANLDPQGRPLPLVAEWHERHMPLDFQMALIRGGHHLLPFVPFPNPSEDPAKAANKSKKKKLLAEGPSLEDSLKELSKWDLPFALMGTQWEGVLTDAKKKWRMMPPEQSALVWSATADAATTKPTLKQISPFGAIAPWEEAGRYWADTPGMKALQDAYPNPPLVFMVSNNEAGNLRWHDVDKDKRYVERYGADKSDYFKRQVLGDGYIERYHAMFNGMREGLSSDAWKQNVRFLAYNAFGPDNFGEGAGWKQYSSITPDRITWNWYAWDGAIPEAYDNGWQPAKTAFNLWSCQTEKFNSVFMKEEALKANPNFWLETVFWDGHSFKKTDDATKDKHLRYEKLGVPYTPDLYGGWVQYVMWTVQPRVAREWRSSGDHPRDAWWPYFVQIIRAVDLVYADPVLTQFWRKGQLVPNRAHAHPFQDDIPDKWKNADRWFGLDTSIDPPRPWELKTRIPVYALAYVIGAKPKRQWLLYAHAPLGEKKNVEITIPDYRKVLTSLIIPGGNFFCISEADGSIMPVGDINSVPAAPLNLP